jgi:hypothetical protein
MFERAGGRTRAGVTPTLAATRVWSPPAGARAGATPAAFQLLVSQGAFQQALQALVPQLEPPTRAPPAPVPEPITENVGESRGVDLPDNVKGVSPLIYGPGNQYGQPGYDYVYPNQLPQGAWGQPAPSQEAAHQPPASSRQQEARTGRKAFR